ncbi:hypothetical protein ACFPPE_06885, partial [Agromyces tardus]|uniref:hypothetical protein n=1 Tax=Agromyces tardus TaxID=2583849 RepID=UPI0036197E6B
THANSALLDCLNLSSVAGIYRVAKQGEGFSALSEVLSGIGEHDVVVINRSIGTPQLQFSYPLTVRLTNLVSPVLQLIELRHDDQVLRVPAAAVESILLTPTSPIFHRSATLDAFYPAAARTARMTTVLDIILV